MNPSLKKLKEESSEDRISDLPDALIHHIFSFLDMRDVVHTSILSNRWKTLWSSTSNLNFSLFLCCRDCVKKFLIYGNDDLCDSCLKKKESFMGFVDRVLFLRENYKINKFNVYCIDTKLDTTRLHTWVLALLGRNVEHLVLNVNFDKTWELLHKLFTANITVLELSCDKYFSSHARLPSSICTAPRIKNLELCSVAFPDGNANGELILGCPVLKTLSMTQCDLSNIKVFTISTPQLESLKLVNIYTKSDKSCQVKMCTPDLKMIKLEVYTRGDVENLMLDYCLENLTSLASAKIGFRYKLTDLIPKEECFEWFMKVMTGIHNVQSLKLSSSFQFLRDFPKSFNKLAAIFSNLKCVILEDPRPFFDRTVLKLLFGEGVQWRYDQDLIYLSFSIYDISRVVCLSAYVVSIAFGMTVIYTRKKIGSPLERKQFEDNRDSWSLS